MVARAPAGWGASPAGAGWSVQQCGQVVPLPPRVTVQHLVVTLALEIEVQVALPGKPYAPVQLHVNL